MSRLGPSRSRVLAARLVPAVRLFLAARLVAAVLVLASCGGGNQGAAPPVYLSREKLLDPATCGECHPKHYQEWSGSMHAYASDDPLFVAMNQRGQHDAQVGPFCVKCHAPMALSEGATTDGLNLDSVPPSLKGITCYFCHAVDAVEGTHDNPLHLAGDSVMRGEFTDPVANTAHASAYSVLHDRNRLESAQLCGTCHDIVNGHGAHIERTYEEWQQSVYVQPNGGLSCAQCHMDQSKTPEPAAEFPGVFSRTLHSHQFPGVDVALTPLPEADTQKAAVQSFLNTTLQSALCVRGFGSGSSLYVILDNVAAGHSWPSGAAQDRRAWVEVTAYANGAPIYQSGVVPAGQAVTAVADPDIWVIRDCMLGAEDTEVHTFWDAVGNESTQLPGQATFDPTDIRFYQTHILQIYPRTASLSAAPDRVTMSVHIQPFGKDVFDDLAANYPGGAPASFTALGAMLPTFDVGTELEWTADKADLIFQESGFPVSCVSTNLSASADKVRAVRRTKCSP